MNIYNGCNSTNNSFCNPCNPCNPRENNGNTCDKCNGNTPGDGCCNANTLSYFDGDLSKVKAEPIYVQKIYDAVLLKMQGLRTVQEQIFSPAIPSGFRIVGISSIRCRKSFNPGNINDTTNLTISAETNVTGASFISNGTSEVTVVGPDGTMSEKILYTDTSVCDEECKGTPIFGTQNVRITGNIVITLNLILMDNCGREINYPVTASISIATSQNPLSLTGFFEMCMPSVNNTAILPRFTELCNLSCETRLATNSCARDLSINANGEVTANLIISLCIACEKKIVVPVELSVLSTGFVQLNETASQQMCTNSPQLYPDSITNLESSDCPNNGNNGQICGCGETFPIIG